MIQIESHPYLTQKPLIDLLKRHQVEVTAYSPLGSGNLLNETHIGNIAKKYNKTPAQVLIKYQIERNVIAIPKSTNKDRIKANFNVFDFKLTQDDISKIESLNKNHRYFDVDVRNHKYYPYKEPF